MTFHDCSFWGKAKIRVVSMHIYSNGCIFVLKLPQKFHFLETRLHLVMISQIATSSTIDYYVNIIFQYPNYTITPFVIDHICSDINLKESVFSRILNWYTPSHCSNKNSYKEHGHIHIINQVINKCFYYKLENVLGFTTYKLNIGC